MRLEARLRRLERGAVPPPRCHVVELAADAPPGTAARVLAAERLAPRASDLIVCIERLCAPQTPPRHLYSRAMP